MSQAAKPVQTDLGLTTEYADPMDAPGMTWLQASVGLAGGGQVLTVQECAESVRMTDRGVVKLIATGHLETVRAGTKRAGDYRVPLTAWLRHLYQTWSHREAATYHQNVTLILHLMRGIPDKALKHIAEACCELLKSRQKAREKARKGQR